MAASYEEIVHLYRLLNIPHQDKVFHGSSAYLPDKLTPVDSDAVQDLIRRAYAKDDLLYVAATGACTNIASAILTKPEIKDRIVVVWFGGQPVHFGHGIEFNLMQDVYAAQVLFESGVPLIYIPGMTVASHLSVSGEELSCQIAGKSAIGDYLTDIVLAQFREPEKTLAGMRLDRFGYLHGQEDQDDAYLAQFQSHAIAWTRTIWDVSAIAYLKNPTWTPSTLVRVPALDDKMCFSNENPHSHVMRQVNYCFRDAIFGDLFECINRHGGI